MKKQITKVNKNYYSIYAEPTCSVFLDEYLMKKANKILYRYRNEMDALLKNNAKHLIKEHWSLAYPEGEQTHFHGTNLKSPERIGIPEFMTRKVENLFFIGEEDIFDKKIEKRITKLLEEDK